MTMHLRNLARTVTLPPARPPARLAPVAAQARNLMACWAELLRGGADWAHFRYPVPQEDGEFAFAEVKVGGASWFSSTHPQGALGVPWGGVKKRGGGGPQGFMPAARVSSSEASLQLPRHASQPASLWICGGSSSSSSSSSRGRPMLKLCSVAAAQKPI